MIELLLITLTWYITKLYYTRDIKVNISNIEDPHLVRARCNKCSASIVTHRENMRNPFYCMPCK